MAGRHRKRQKINVFIFCTEVFFKLFEPRFKSPVAHTLSPLHHYVADLFVLNHCESEALLDENTVDIWEELQEENAFLLKQSHLTLGVFHFFKEELSEMG